MTNYIVLHQCLLPPHLLSANCSSTLILVSTRSPKIACCGFSLSSFHQSSHDLYSFPAPPASPASAPQSTRAHPWGFSPIPLLGKQCFINFNNNSRNVVNSYCFSQRISITCRKGGRNKAGWANRSRRAFWSHTLTPEGIERYQELMEFLTGKYSKTWSKRMNTW